MSKHTYHIDPAAGDDANDGLAPARPFRTYAGREFAGGDTVLFKRGSLIRAGLDACNGSEEAPITYGAYGAGDKPAFLGSVPAGDPGQWVEERPSLWRYIGTFPSEVCNLIFNAGESCGNLRWRIEDLRKPGEWHYTGIGRHSAGEGWRGPNPHESVLYLYSPTNPGRAYADIECALWGQRDRLVSGQRHIVLENLSFRNAGVHAYHEYHAHNIVIRHCEFRFIGGGVFIPAQRVRFGNAIQFWDGASDITIEGCLFHNIYDSGVTHQGGETRNIPERLYFRDNLFIDCGMAAYECREPSQEVYFEHNTCINAGGGFSMQGEPPPRRSEIYPQPMGHHVFVWKIDPNTQPGNVYIRHNVFHEAPYGAAIYAIVDSADERKFILDHNDYWQTTGELLIHLSGRRSYPPMEFARYQAECGQDGHSLMAQPLFVDAAGGDYRQRPDSPCLDMGLRHVRTERQNCGCNPRKRIP